MTLYYDVVSEDVVAYFENDDDVASKDYFLQRKLYPNFDKINIKIVND